MSYIDIRLERIDKEKEDSFIEWIKNCPVDIRDLIIRRDELMNSFNKRKDLIPNRHGYMNHIKHLTIQVPLTELCEIENGSWKFLKHRYF